MEPTTCIEAEPYALRVLDDSMEPEFRRDSIIIIDPTGLVRHGAYVIAEIEGRMVFRQLRAPPGKGSTLAPLNPVYPSTELDNGLNAIKGVVTQRAGRRRQDHKRYD